MAGTFTTAGTTFQVFEIKMLFMFTEIQLYNSVAKSFIDQCNTSEFQMHMAGSDIQQSFRAIDKFLGLGASKCSPMRLHDHTMISRRTSVPLKSIMHPPANLRVVKHVIQVKSASYVVLIHSLIIRVMK